MFRQISCKNDENVIASSSARVRSHANGSVGVLGFVRNPPPPAELETSGYQSVRRSPCCSSVRLQKVRETGNTVSFVTEIALLPSSCATPGPGPSSPGPRRPFQAPVIRGLPGGACKFHWNSFYCALQALSPWEAEEGRTGGVVSAPASSPSAQSGLRERTLHTAHAISGLIHQHTRRSDQPALLWVFTPSPVNNLMDQFPRLFYTSRASTGWCT